ncbi:hypothetical protein KIH74_05765 [Kineosporia sp. J2-2]|uniref:Uncharacterized protein n=1 Tax=Kineosporia corallincola TaxID=2835133 RepID=A0ABS5TBG3_9ACTN|nr:hypothetical protein [Kineosporia corallincola]MBT0768421.1 hypothetical protein [Kineosporia corallincola]
MATVVIGQAGPASAATTTTVWCNDVSGTSLTAVFSGLTTPGISASDCLGASGFSAGESYVLRLTDLSTGAVKNVSTRTISSSCNEEIDVYGTYASPLVQAGCLP